ncbi:MAG: DUF3108 domain-containing protein [Pseudomonadota bacterium]|nr:DUF3108 domain-containing protein [Pseudomonadota bacterium]
MLATELAVPRPVFPEMMSFAPPRRSRGKSSSPLRVHPALLAALALSLLLHLAWSMWPVEPTVANETPVLTVTLTEMPPPPVPTPAPPPAPAPAVERSPAPAMQPGRKALRIEHPPVITAPNSPLTTKVDASPAESPTTDNRSVATTAAIGTSTAAAPDIATGAPETPAPPPVVLPPRLDLAYKVFFGTRGFMIGDATYRFEHTGDRYRISTVAQARGLAALIVHGTGKIESLGRITPNGLKPYEFAIERGSADKREVAYFDWGAGNVVLHDGAIAPLEAPAFDPLTILWQSYFSPPSRNDQTFSLATTRRVSRYTLSLEGEETLAWPRGNVLTQRWHRTSEDGKSEAWFWLAPSMHYIPVKMRITRTSRGTLEVLLDSIRADATDAPGTDAEPPRRSDNTPFKPWNPMAPVPGPDATGQ